MTFDFSNHGPFELARRLERRTAELRRWKRYGGAHPFGSEHFPGKTTFDAVREMPDFDPLKRPLLRSVHRLTETRIALPFLAHERWLLHDEQVAVVQPAHLLLSREELRVHLLRAREEQRPAWTRSWARHEQALSDHRLQMWTTYAEVSERLGERDLVGFWDPVSSSLDIDRVGVSADPLVGKAPPSQALPADDVPGVPAVRRAPERGVTSLGRELLRQTKDAAEECIGEGYPAFLAAAVALEASEGWPARLVPDALRDLLRIPELLRGVKIDPELPARLVPMSFPRAIQRVGHAIALALAPSDLPFVVAYDCDELPAHRLGHLLALSSLSPAFLRRHLGLSGDRLGRGTRALAIAELAHLRLEAARAIWAEAALTSIATLPEVFAESSAQLLLGEELPPTSCLARFSVPRDQAARFAGLLWAGATAARLVEEFDEDWLQNPRAQEWLRAELSQPAVTSVPHEECELGIRSLIASGAARL